MASDIKITDELIVSTMNGVVENFLKPKFIELGMSASGQWLNTVQGGVENGNGVIYGMDYTYWLANGRKPGTAPPVSALIPWVTAKLGVGGSQAISVAFAVAQKIKNEGTEYYPNGTDLLTVLESKEVKDYIYLRFGQGVTAQINELLKKQINDNFN